MKRNYGQTKNFLEKVVFVAASAESFQLREKC